MYEYWQQQAHLRSNGQIGAHTGKLLISFLNEQNPHSTFILHSTYSRKKEAWFPKISKIDKIR